MLAFMGLSDRTKFRRKYIHQLLEVGILEQTIPNKPKSQNQKYRLTSKGIALKNLITWYFANYSPNWPELLRWATEKLLQKDAISHIITKFE